MSGRRSSGNGRSQTQRIASGARANPYSRPETSGRKPSGSLQGAQQLSIRGASGPTWIVVGNLLRGTSEEDIQETFRQFGNIEAVRVFSDKPTSLSFEVAYTHASSAQGAIDKLHGVLADGRVLSVRKRDSTPSSATSATTTNRLPANVPVAPKSLLKAQQQMTGTVSHGKPGKSGNGSLESRLLTATELNALAKKQEKAKKAKVGMNQASPASLALAKRIGSLPLSMRLGAENANGKASGSKAGGAKSSATTTTTTASQKRKRAKAAAKAKAAATGGMQLD